MINLCLGTQTNGDKFYTTLEQARHLLICGYSGCGKTTLVYHLLEQMNNAKIYIFDIVKIYFSEYAQKKNVTVANSSNGIKQCLDDILAQYEYRASQHKYNEQPIVIIVDAYENFIYECNFDILPYLEKFAYAEKIGIHLIITSQYTKRPYSFRSILLNSSIICMSIDYRKLYLSVDKKLFPNDNSTVAQIIGENSPIKLLPTAYPYKR